jgi:basic membrane protein A
MNRRKSLTLLLCLGLTAASSRILPATAATTPASAFRVGLVLDKNGKSDKGFNAAANTGINRAVRAFQFTADVKEASGDAGHEPLLREFASRGYDLVIALGGARAAAVKKVAAEFPKVKFAIVDAEVKAPNVRSILFEEQEGSFLVGAIAGLMSKSGKNGFIGGMDIPLIHRYGLAYRAGAKRTLPSVTVSQDFVGKTSEAWSNPARGKELALAQYNSGADIIFAAAGATNLGVFDATEEKAKFAIGVSNQNGIKPGRILTSMIKRVDIGVFMTCQDAKLGELSAGTKRYGLSSQGVDFVIDNNNRAILPKSVLDKVESLRSDVIDGKIKVPDYLAGAR